MVIYELLMILVMLGLCIVAAIIIGALALTINVPRKCPLCGTKMTYKARMLHKLYGPCCVFHCDKCNEDFFYKEME